MLIVPHDASGDVLVCTEGLSFWGGVDPDTGMVIDAHHPQNGVCLAGRIVLMPTSRGSCSGSGVLLELARNGHAPAALVFHENEDILTLGAIIAGRLFDCSLAVVRLPKEQYDALSRADTAEIQGSSILFEGQAISLALTVSGSLKLDNEDRKYLDGKMGHAAQVAMEVLCLMAVAQGATELTTVSRGHIDGCILAHDANLDFAEKMLQMGARTVVPTTINAISVDRENWHTQAVPPDFGSRASRLADAYVKMGARPTFTCAPYLLDGHPVQDEAIGWSESNAVIFANTVLGARTQKHPDYLDLFIAMTGRAPLSGVYLARNRVPACELRVDPPAEMDDAFWPLLGWIAGSRSPQAIPLITGLEKLSPSKDDLKAMCAAFGTTSAAPMLHIFGHTPEANLPLRPGAPVCRIGIGDFAKVWRDFNVPADTIDLVALGSPHASYFECLAFAEALGDRHCHPETDTIITVGRNVMAQCEASGVLHRLKNAGVQIIPDLCWCSITEPVFPRSASTLMTNSGKYAHYANGLTGRAVRFGSLGDCAEAAVTGKASNTPPKWLEDG
jgi:predicted aconitase/predicted aconitase with swiveling domain